MATLMIRQLDETVKAKLRVRAAEHGKSMEEEAREILRQAVAAPAAETGAEWVSHIRQLVEPFSGFHRANLLYFAVAVREIASARSDKRVDSRHKRDLGNGRAASR
jgi:plasmid stability protein